MKKRTIMIFPQFENMKVIDEIREKYDPLAQHVRPHISLVFTFESDIEKDLLKKHIEGAVRNFREFNLTMKKFIGISNELGRYIFLTVDEGLEEIKKLSRNLYTDVLDLFKPLWLNDETYFPHMTVGEFKDDESLKKALGEIRKKEYEFKTIVDKVSVEIIDENEDSIIEMEVNFAKPYTFYKKES